MTDDPLELEHPAGCWMDPRPHLHRIHLLERPAPPAPDPRLVVPDVVRDPGGPVALAGIPRPPIVRRRA